MNDENRRSDPVQVTGLTDAEVASRKAQGLVNTAQESITKTPGQIVRENLFTLFNAFNFAIALSLLWVRAYSNMLYLITVLSNITIGIGQGLYARNIVKNLSLIGQRKVGVMRNGAEHDIQVEELVMDDILVLTAGCQVCADADVVLGTAEVNESLLTGEADPVVKNAGDGLLSGSFITSGKCFARVIHVGADNYAAKLAHEAKKYKQAASEFIRSMRRVTKFTSYFITPTAVLMFIQAFFLRHDSLSNSVIETSAALLGMLPKGLVLLTSTSLIVGIIRLSKKKMLIQDLYAIETLAHVDMLCLDKTGTITEGKMTVSGLYDCPECVMPVTAEQAVACFMGAAEGNNATFLALAERFPADYTYQAVRQVPFSSDRKWGSVTFKDIGTIYIGAPESLPGGVRALPKEAADELDNGSRVLCLGYSEEQGEGTDPVVVPAAYIMLNDPIRKGANETLAFFRREGVMIKVISGDHPLTVSHVARQAGFSDYASYIDMTGVTDPDAVESAAEIYSIFGRVSPGQKKMLVMALQKKGHTVAMTGDGVNDVLALKEADCSIAMAAGSDATRQVSQMVLLNSDFTALPDAVMEGRRVVNNITRFGSLFLIKTIFSIFVSLFSMVTFTPFPFIPTQITIYDFLIEGYPSFILQFEPNRKRITDIFLPTVIKSALPYAMMILFNIAVVTVLYPLMGWTTAHAFTIMFYITGFMSVIGIFRFCSPLNWLRGFICSTVAAGFYLALVLFHSMLHMDLPTLTSFGVFAALAVFSVPLSAYLADWAKRSRIVTRGLKSL